MTVALAIFMETTVRTILFSLHTDIISGIERESKEKIGIEG